ncbi:MAG TPA: OmpA family protein [Polyangiaceae bacterium]|nr:OmpA family protein [Polyangiaceae bacterium]
MKKIVSALSLLLGLQALACGSSAPPPAAPAQPVAEPTPAPAPAPTEKPGDDPRQSDINISDEIKLACGLTETEAHFGYNSAKVLETDQTIMKKLADCFTTGKLKGRTMRLVGHADPRGEPEYNMVLGGRRADNVGAALKNAGLPAAQVTTTSRGEMDSTGTDEASWAADRRVDIHLAE